MYTLSGLTIDETNDLFPGGAPAESALDTHGANNGSEDLIPQWLTPVRVPGATTWWSVLSVL